MNEEIKTRAYHILISYDLLAKSLISSVVR